MGRYILNRILSVIPVLILVSIIVFSLIHLIPGSPVDYIYAETMTTTPEMRPQLEKALGLDKPLPEQYLTWMGKIVRGDFGESIFYRRSNAELIAERFPATLLLTLTATFLAVLLAVPLGVFAAIRRHTAVDYFAMVFSLIGISVPHFWLGILLILAFSLYLPILPSSGYVLSLTEPWETLKHFVLPAVTMGTGMAAIVARMTRSEMLEELGKEYIRTARAKGVPERSIIFKHALKNALVPTITVVGLHLGRLLGGAVIIEYIFGWPGIGGLVVDAIYSRDYPLVQVLILFFALIFVSINLVVDIFYKYADPRIRM
jgi:peptide/nickel transport system permease protein